MVPVAMATGGDQDNGDGDDGSEEGQPMLIREWCAQNKLSQFGDALHDAGVVDVSYLRFIDEPVLVRKGFDDFVARRILDAIYQVEGYHGPSWMDQYRGGVDENPKQVRGGGGGASNASNVHYLRKKKTEDKKEADVPSDEEGRGGVVQKRCTRIKVPSKPSDALIKQYGSRVAWCIYIGSRYAWTHKMYVIVDNKTKNGWPQQVRYYCIMQSAGASFWPHAPRLAMFDVLKDGEDVRMVDVIKKEKSKSFNPNATDKWMVSRKSPLFAWDDWSHDARLGEVEKQVGKRKLVDIMAKYAGDPLIGELMDWHVYAKQFNITDEELKILSVIRTKTDDVIDMDTAEIHAALNTARRLSQH